MSESEQPQGVDLRALTERFLECDICCERFDENERHPRLMPCLHTFCKYCIKKLIQNETIKCPKCVRVHAVPQNCIEIFPKDNTRRDLMDFVNVQNEPSKVLCEDCDKSSPAKYRCKDCSDFLCDECYNFHIHSRHFKDHKIFPIDHVDSNIRNIANFFHEGKCTVPGHETESLKLYCGKDTCKKPICTVCAFAEHKESNNHIICDIKAAYDDRKKYLEGRQKEIEKKIDMVQNAVQDAEGEKSCLEENANRTKEEIVAQFDTCMKILERRKTDIMNMVDNTRSHKSKVLQTQVEELNSLKDIMADACYFLNQSLLYKNYPAFLEISPTIEHRFKYLIDEKVDLVPHENSCLQFAPAQMGMEFQKHINATGEVHAISAYPPNTITDAPEVVNQNKDFVIKVSLRDYEAELIVNKESLVTIKIETDIEDINEISLPCESCDDGQYQVKVNLGCPGNYRIGIFILDKLFSSQWKEIEVKAAAELQNESYEGTDESLRKQSSVKVEDKPFKGTVVSDAKQSSELQNKSSKGTDESLTKHQHKSSKGTDESLTKQSSGMDFVFDDKTLYSKLYISEDRLVISHTESDTTCKIEPGETTFKKYKGVRATSAIYYPEKCIIEVKIDYTLIKDLSDTGLVFEIAFVKEESIDKYLYCGLHKETQSFYVRRCPDCKKLCSKCVIADKVLNHQCISDMTQGTSYTGYLTFHVDTEHGEIRVSDHTKDLIYTFTNVDCTEKLWPMFGLYNAHLLKARMTLLNVVKAKHLKLPTLQT